MASTNSHALLSSPLDDRERARLLKDAGPPSGHFRLDFARACALLGVVPHPQLVSLKPPFVTLAEQEKKEAEAAAAAAAPAANEGEEKKEEKAAPVPVAQKAAPPAPAATSAPKAGSKSGGGAAGGKGKAGAAEPKLTPAQRAAAELAERVAALSPEEALPVTEAGVRGWTMDVGSMQALQMTVPSCKSLHTLRFWNASLSTRALSLLSECLKGSSITRLYVDANPLSRAAGDEGGLVFSLLLAPSSPVQLLSLRSNNLGDAEAGELMRTLSANKNLQALDLWDNQLTDKSAPDVARMLGLNAYLLSLNLARNRLADGAAAALASSLSAQLITDKEEAKVLKKAGFRIHVQSKTNKTFRESNGALRYLNLSDNYVGESGLQAWADCIAEQVRLAPARGLLQRDDGQEVPAMSLLPPHIQEAERAVQQARQQAEVKAREETEAAAMSRVSSAGGNVSGAGSSRKARAAAASAAASGATGKDGASAAGTAVSAEKAAAAALAAAKEEEASRWPGQLNALVQVDLRNQHARRSERVWHVLACSGPLVAWTRDADDTWGAEDANLDIRALDEERAKQAEAERIAAQTDEEKMQEAQEATRIAEAAAAQALQAAQEALEKKSAKASSSGSKKKAASTKSSARGGEHD